MRRNLLFLAAVSLMLCFTLASTTVQPILAQPVSTGAIVKQISGKEAWDFCDYLASPEFEGRLAGDTGQYEAGDWIAEAAERGELNRFLKRILIRVSGIGLLDFITQMDVNS